VPDASTATKWGHGLSEYGIDLIPYIPDESHSFILQLFDYIEEFRSSRQGVSSALNNVSDYIRTHRYFDAASTLRNVLAAKRLPPSQKKPVADQLVAFFADPVAKSSSIDAIDGRVVEIRAKVEAQSETMRVLGQEAIVLISGFIDLVADP